jgi:hypothetical protein
MRAGHEKKRVGYAWQWFPCQASRSAVAKSKRMIHPEILIQIDAPPQVIMSTLNYLHIVEGGAPTETGWRLVREAAVWGPLEEGALARRPQDALHLYRACVGPVSVIYRALSIWPLKGRAPGCPLPKCPWPLPLIETTCGGPMKSARMI